MWQMGSYSNYKRQHGKRSEAEWEKNMKGTVG